jgi:hypothetical protein
MLWTCWPSKWEELDDEKVIICPACPAHDAVVLQPNDEIDFAVVLDDVIWRSKTLRETHVTHIAPEHLGPWPRRAKATSFLIVAPATTHVAYVVLGACPFTPMHA